MESERHEVRGATHTANLVVALLVHVLVGLPWLSFVTAITALFNSGGGVVWGLSGLALWIIGFVQAVRGSEQFAAPWGAVLGAWLRILVAPIALLFVVVRAWQEDGAPATAPIEEEPVNPEVARRLEVLERRLQALASELDEVRRLAEAGPVRAPEAPPAEPARPIPQPPPAVSEPTPVRTAPAPPPAPPRREPPPSPPRREPAWWDRDIDFGEFLGAKGLAWAGGIVTVLGVVFFFVLAVNRGWVGPVERVTLGAIASAIVFAAGLWLHRRYGPVYSVYGAVGAGLAGGYATLLASAALYELVSDLAALAIAGTIAAIGLATALRWGSELVAGIGLVGATLVPLMVLLEEDISPLGTGFAGIVFAATAAVAAARRWPTLLGAGFAASVPQIALLVADGRITDWDRVILAGIFAALYVGAALALHWRTDEHGLHSLSATLMVAAGVVAGATGAWLFGGDDEGWMIVAAGGAFAAVGAVLFPRERDRDASALLAAIGLALVAVGLAIVFSGPTLALAWAAEAAVLAWLAQRIDEPRYQVLALGYLAAAAVHALAVDAPPLHLFEARPDPADGALAPAGVAIAAAVVAWYSREWLGEHVRGGFFAAVEPLLGPIREAHAFWREVAAWLAGIVGIYAASLGVLALAQAIDDSPVQLAFERGHVLLTGFWGFLGLALVLVSRRLGSMRVNTGGWLLAAVTFVHSAVFEVIVLDGDRRGVALLVAAVALLATAFADELPTPFLGTTLSVPSAFAAVGAAALAFGGLHQLTHDATGAIDPRGAAWLGLAVVFAALAALVLQRDRDFATVLWAAAFVIGVAASTELVSGTWLVLAWSAVAAATTVVAALVDDERLQLPAAGYLLLALGFTLTEQAPPAEFFRANDDPAAGVPSLVFALGALVVFGVYALRDHWAAYRTHVWTAAAVLGLYSVSLSILGVFQWIGAASVETDFQRGHSAVSTFWGIVGLIALYAGLTRSLRALRVAGFALFGVALAKLFLYDLAFLSSITRALSFLAVGAVLLLAGFFYQRLAAATTREAS